MLVWLFIVGKVLGLICSKETKFLGIRFFTIPIKLKNSFLHKPAGDYITLKNLDDEPQFQLRRESKCANNSFLDRSKHKFDKTYQEDLEKETEYDIGGGFKEEVIFYIMNSYLVSFR